MSSPDPTAWTQTARQCTEAAALAGAPWVGHGNKDAADRAAVEALQNRARAHDLRGRVVIGEGEKDDAPYLEPGTEIGSDLEPVVDIAVDPLEGTTLVANEAPGALRTGTRPGWSDASSGPCLLHGKVDRPAGGRRQT